MTHQKSKSWNVLETVLSHLKFPRRCVDGKYLMRFQSKTGSVFKFFLRSIDGALVLTHVWRFRFNRR